MQILYFTLIGILLYLFSDWILQRIELAVGRRLKQRTLLFFGILLLSAFAAFSLIRQLVA